MSLITHEITVTPGEQFKIYVGNGGRGGKGGKGEHSAGCNYDDSKVMKVFKKENEYNFDNATSEMQCGGAGATGTDGQPGDSGYLSIKYYY